MEPARQLAHRYLDQLPERSVVNVLNFLKYYHEREGDEASMENVFAMCMAGLEEEWDNPDDEVWNDV